MSNLRQRSFGTTRNFSIKLRLCFSVLTVLHLVILATKLLLIDFTKAEEPMLQVYHYRRWKLITSWVNLMMLSYYPISLYCEWRESRHEADCRHVTVLNRVRHAVFCNILAPATFFADTLFWRLWNKDRELLMPKGLETFVPYWIQHSLHTVSLVVIMVDLIITPRARPRSLKPGVAMMSLFVAAYVCMCYVSWAQGEYIYPCLENMSNFKIVCLIISMFIEHLLYFTIQWIVVDLIWGTKRSIKIRI